MQQDIEQERVHEARRVALRDAMENGQLVLMELIYRGNEKKGRIAEQRRVVAHAQAALAGAGAGVLEPLQRRKNEY